jgi:hypothetical protein
MTRWASFAWLAALALATVPSCKDAPRPQPVTAPLPAASGSAAEGDTEGQPGSTPGAIACGEATCKTDGEICCLDPAAKNGRCVARPAGALPGDLCGALPVTMACDDAADCAGGNACCIEDISSGDVTFHAHECGPFPCNVEEVCVTGGPCLKTGWRCEERASDLYTGGVCLFDDHGVGCGPRRCSGDAAICCWDGAKGEGRCVASSDDCIVRDESGMAVREDLSALGCRSAADCGGYTCARNAMVPSGPIFGCVSRWAAGDMGWVILCETAADCPDYFGRKVDGCVATEGMPPGTKVCAYVEVP